MDMCKISKMLHFPDLENIRITTYMLMWGYNNSKMYLGYANYNYLLSRTLIGRDHVCVQQDLLPAGHNVRQVFKNQ